MELIQKYSITELIFIFTVAGIALKSFITFCEWGHERLNKFFNRDTKEEKQKRIIQNRLDEYDKLLKNLSEDRKELQNTLDILNERVNLLIKSDKDDIKAYITREHHYFCYQKGWIDDYSLDCIERRFEHYLEEKGNSFVEGLMEEIRDLPMKPPQKTDK